MSNNKIEDKADKPIQVVYNRKRQVRQLQTRGNLGARTASSTMIRASRVAITLTGGLDVQKKGFIKFKKDGIAQPYKKVFVNFHNGLFKIYDPDALSGKAAKKAFFQRRKKDLLGNIESCDDKAEEVIDILQLKEVVYSKRNGSTFELVARPNGSRNSLKRMSKDPSRQSRVSRMSRVSNAIRSKSFSAQRTEGAEIHRTESVNKKRYSSILPMSWASTNQDKTFRFKFKACSGTAEEWVQAILFEIRNQACFTDGSIQALMDSANNSVRLSITDDLIRMDNLYRQSVDLWALAKGKISLETLAVLTRFVEFLERFGVHIAAEKNSDEEKANSKLDIFTEGRDQTTELENWKQTTELIRDLLQKEKEHAKDNFDDLKSGLVELQYLNDPDVHDEAGDFKYTTRVLNEQNNALAKKEDTLRSKFSLSGLTLRRARKRVSGLFSRSKERKSLNLDDIELVSKDEHNKEEKEETLERMFTSAVDMKRNRERKEEEQLMKQLTQHSRSPNQLIEIGKQEGEAEIIASHTL